MTTTHERLGGLIGPVPAPGAPAPDPPRAAGARRRPLGSDRRLWGRVGAVVLLTFQLNGITLEELQRDPKLTPKRFASYFADFEYCYHEEVQKPEVFLATKSGDCDDYAILADLVLKPKGYETRLISVRMPGLTPHVVCYVTQERAYLDFNNRIYVLKLERCGPKIREIATKVAHSFSANWTTASEFTYTKGMKYMVATVVKTDPPKTDPAPGRAQPGSERPGRPIVIDF